MRAFFYCPNWTPTNSPPSPFEQTSTNQLRHGMGTTWEPERCHFSIDGEGDYPWNPDFGFPYVTGAQCARRVRCLTHRTRPTGYQRSWRANSQWATAFDRHFYQNYTPLDEIPGWREQWGAYWEGQRYVPSAIIIWYARRAEPRTTHFYWATA